MVVEKIRHGAEIPIPASPPAVKANQGAPGVFRRVPVAYQGQAVDAFYGYVFHIHVPKGQALFFCRFFRGLLLCLSNPFHFGVNAGFSFGKQGKHSFGINRGSGCYTGGKAPGNDGAFFYGNPSFLRRGRKTRSGDDLLLKSIPKAVGIIIIPTFNCVLN